MSETANPQPDALIVGAGPVGLAMAIQLTRHGVPCRIIDKNPAPSAHSKALGVHARTLEIFEDWGVIEAALDRGHKVHGLNAYADGQRIVHITMDDIDSPYPFILILPQSDTERVLIEHLDRLGVPVERNWELTAFQQTEAGVTSILKDVNGNEQTVQTRWLLGCDGARSTVRHILNLPFEGATYEEYFFLADVRLHWDRPHDEMHIFLNPDVVMVVFPMPGKERVRFVTFGLDPARASAIAEPDLDFWKGILKELGLEGVEITDPVWQSAFRIHRRMVSHSRVGNCFLAGDAAHIHSPAGGQGMNTGIQDAYNLGWKLGLVKAAATSDTLLDSYQAERHPIAAATLHDTDMLTRAVALRIPLAKKARNLLVSTLSSFDFIRQRFTSTMAELALNYRKSPLVAEDRATLLQTLLSARFSQIGECLDFGAAPTAGDRAPDLVVSFEGPGPKRLFEVLHGTKHVLLLLTGPDPQGSTAKLTAIAARVKEGFGSWIDIHVAVPSATPPAGLGDVAFLPDPGGSLHRRYGAASDCLYLVRPDGYIGYRSQPADGDKLLAFLGRVFVSR